MKWWLVLVILLAGCADPGPDREAEPMTYPWEDNAGDPATAPNIQFQKDETADELKVIRVDQDGRWERLAFRGDGLMSARDGTWKPSGTTHDPGTITAGETVSFCVKSGSRTTVSVLDVPTNQVIAEFTFQTLQACP